MKKTILAIATFLTLNAGIGFASPINDLAQGQTAVGIGNDTFYLEHKLSHNFTLGLQNVDWNNVGNANDIYGQIQLTNNLKGIIGNRDFNSNSKMYFGVAVNSSLTPEADGYASLIAGSEFKELQIGTNFRLAHNVDLNLNYHSFIPDVGSNKNGVGAGVTFKF